MPPPGEVRLAAAGLLLASAALLIRPSAAEAARRRLGAHAKLRGPRRLGLAQAACAAVAVAVALGLPRGSGVVAAPLAYAIARAALRRLPSAGASQPAAGQLAAGVELVAACLEAGAVPAAALQMTGQWLPGPLGGQFAAAGWALGQGLDVADALSETPALAPVGAVLRRSARSGSAMTTQLVAAAEQLRADDQFDRLERARRLSVLSVLPLGLCMLPAFLLLAVVPAVAGLGRGLLH